MAKQHIHSLMHKLAEVSKLDPEVLQLAKVPQYVISDEIIKILPRKDVQTSIAAMIEAEVLRMPSPDALFEFSIDPHTRRFVRVQELDNGHFRCRVAKLVRNGQQELAAIARDNYDIVVEGETLVVKTGNDYSNKAAAIFAVSLGLLLLNTRGITKELIDPAKINALRLKKNHKVKILRHYLIRIGTIYGRNNEVYERNTTGKHMPVHFRSAHTRRQHYGPGNSETKIIFIPGLLVNFRSEDGEEAVPR